MTLSPDQEAIIKQEEQILGSVVDSLASQLTTQGGRLRNESDRARELTSNLVAARRVEDKAMLASDEAVAHVIRDKMTEELKNLTSLLEKPYFARVVVEEDTDAGIKEYEYKIGFKANPTCRIVDWRKAPLSKLYYQYQEGEDYSEEIQGRERNGTVLLRNRVEIEKSKLKRISTASSSFVQSEGSWVVDINGTRSRAAGSYSRLPSVLSLITPEQFRSITEEARTAILIQGVAGSGKTTVALHRLAWLLHEDNSDLSSLIKDSVAPAAIVVRTRSLQAYIVNSLPFLDITSVPVFTFSEYTNVILKGVLSPSIRPDTSCPTSVERLLRSMAVLAAVEEEALKGTAPTDESGYYAILSKVLSFSDAVLKHDETKLLNKDLIDQGRCRLLETMAAGTRDQITDALFLRIYQLFNPSSKNKYEHLVVDEIQDFSPVELATIIGSVPSTDRLTLVGDVSQNLDPASAFPGWVKLMKHWKFDDGLSKYIGLEVSFRSTLPVMKLADYIQGSEVVKTGRAGRVPIWFKCGSESQGIGSVIDWLKRAIEKYPSSLTAVLCRDKQQAKYAFSMLLPTFGPAVRFTDEDHFSLEEGIVVSAITDVKGLEFTNVLLWNPSKSAYPGSQLDRNLLYVAVTRAEENVCLVSWDQASKLLPPFNSPLIRGLNLAIED